MTGKRKPDWAERLQRTFKRKYFKGVSDENARISKLFESEFSGYAYVRISVRDLLELIKREEND